MMDQDLRRKNNFLSEKEQQRKNSLGRLHGQLYFGSGNLKAQPASQPKLIQIGSKEKDSRLIDVKKETFEVEAANQLQRNRDKIQEEDPHYSLQRPGVNRNPRQKEKEKQRQQNTKKGNDSLDRYDLSKNYRPLFNPRQVVFKSHYDQFGRVAENKDKELSRASLSSDSYMSGSGSVSQNQNLSNG